MDAPASHRFRLRHPKRLIIILGASLLFVALIAYGVLSFLTWRGLDDHSQTAPADLKAAIDQTLGAKDPTGTPAEQITRFVADFDKKYGDDPCQISPIFGWQTFIPAFAQIKADCTERFEGSLDVVAAAQPITDFLNDQKTAADLLEKTMTAQGEPTDYVAAANAWRALKDSAEIPTHANFTPVADTLRDRAEAIAAAYDKLATALEQESRALFDEGAQELQTGYTALASIKVSADTARDRLIEKFLAAYDKL